jgi:hypothetical protein
MEILTFCVKFFFPDNYIWFILASSFSGKTDFSQILIGTYLKNLKCQRGHRSKEMNSMRTNLTFILCLRTHLCLYFSQLQSVILFCNEKNDSRRKSYINGWFFDVLLLTIAAMIFTMLVAGKTWSCSWALKLLGNDSPKV